MPNTYQRWQHLGFNRNKLPAAPAFTASNQLLTFILGDNVIKTCKRPASLPASHHFPGLPKYNSLYSHCCVQSHKSATMPGTRTHLTGFPAAMPRSHAENKDHVTRNEGWHLRQGLTHLLWHLQPVPDCCLLRSFSANSLPAVRDTVEPCHQPWIPRLSAKLLIWGQSPVLAIAFQERISSWDLFASLSLCLSL